MPTSEPPTHAKHLRATEAALYAAFFVHADGMAGAQAVTACNEGLISPTPSVGVGVGGVGGECDSEDQGVLSPGRLCGSLYWWGVSCPVRCERLKNECYCTADLDFGDVDGCKAVK